MNNLSEIGVTSKQIVDSLHEAVVITDIRGTIQFVNSMFCELTGYAPVEVIGRNPRILKSGIQGSNFYRKMWETLQATGYWQGEICNRKKSGEIYTEWLTISAIRDSYGAVKQYIGVFTDISQRKRAEQEIWHKAHHDVLTGLPNRSLFMLHLQQALAQSRRSRTMLAVLFLDLDHVKKVNDALGHATGDRLLQEVAARLRSSIREVDIVARLGGDEFVLLLPNLNSSRDIFKIAEIILDVLRAPFHLKGESVAITGSVGISIFPDDGLDEESLISHADAAMYEAKKAGRDRYQTFLMPQYGV